MNYETLAARVAALEHEVRDLATQTAAGRRIALSGARHHTHAQRVIRTAARTLNVHHADVVRARAKRDNAVTLARRVAILLLHKLNYGASDIARALDCHHSTIIHSTRRGLDALGKDARLTAAYEDCIHALEAEEAAAVPPPPRPPAVQRLRARQPVGCDIAVQRLGAAVLHQAVDELRSGDADPRDRTDARTFLFSAESAGLRRFWADAARINAARFEQALARRSA